MSQDIDFMIPPNATGGGGSGITQLTGDVTAGPGSGAQVAAIASGAVTLPKTAFGGSDGQFLQRASGVWAPANMVPLGPGPDLNGYKAWAYDPFVAVSATLSPGAGYISWFKFSAGMSGFTVTQIDLFVTTGGAGLSNCFLGIYDSTGTRQYVSADQSTSWQTAGLRSVTGVATALTPGGTYYLAFLVGGFTGQPVFAANKGANGVSNNTILANAGLTVGTARSGFQGPGLSALPASYTPASNTFDVTILWFGLK